MSRPKRGTRNGKKAPKLKQARVDHQVKQPDSTNDGGDEEHERQSSDPTVAEGTDGDEDTGKRLADDLVVVRRISLLDALCGCRLLIKHPEGRKLLLRTQPGQITKPEAFFRVRGGGFKRPGQQLSNDSNQDHRRLTGGLRGIRGSVDKKCSPWGDLLLGLKVMFPPSFFLNDRARYEHLASLLRPVVDDPYGGRLLNFNSDEGSKPASTAEIKKEVELSDYDPTRYAPRMGEENERFYQRGVPPGRRIYTPPPGCNIQ